MKVNKIEVLTDLTGTDRVNLYLDAPTPFPNLGYDACATVQVAAGHGIAWALNAFGAEAPIVVINTRSGESRVVSDPARTNVSST